MACDYLLPYRVVGFADVKQSICPREMILIVCTQNDEIETSNDVPTSMLLVAVSLLNLYFPKPKSHTSNPAGFNLLK